MSNDDKEEKELITPKIVNQSEGNTEFNCMPRTMRIKAYRDMPKVKEDPTKAPILYEHAKLGDGRWTITAIIGGGGFGQIYLASDKLQPDKLVVVKVGHRTRSKDTQRMYLEIDAIKQMVLNKSEHAPKFWGCGQNIHCANPYNYYVMDLVSKSLSDIRRASPMKYLTIATSIRLFQQMISAFRDVHQCGYIHRDVKPSNMAMGIGEAKQNTLYLLDFGLVRRYLTRSGKLRRERHRAAFRGTQRYATLRAHERKEQCRADDLISAYYTTLELANGKLPWSNISNDKKITHSKQRIVIELECKYMPAQMVQLWHAINGLGYNDEPNYKQYLNLTTESLILCSEADAPYDWYTPNWEALRTEKRTKHFNLSLSNKN